jgi:hypothetical protein
MSKIVMGQSTPHWAQRVGDFLGNMGAEQRQQRQIEEQQRQQAMAQEIERYRKFVASAPPEQKELALQRVPEEFRGYVSIEATEFQKNPLQVAQEQAALAEAQQKAAAAGAKTSDISGGNPILRNAGVGYSDKIIELVNDEARMALFPPDKQELIRAVAAKIAPDANTVLNSDTTRRGQDTQVAVANINQGGANFRHTSPSADASMVDSRSRDLTGAGGQAGGKMDNVIQRRIGLINSAGQVLEQIGDVTGQLVTNSRNGNIVQANRDRKKLEGLINAAATVVARAAGEDRVAKEDAQRFKSLITPNVGWTLADPDMADQMLIQARDLLYNMRGQLANSGGGMQPRPAASPSPGPSPDDADLDYDPASGQLIPRRK